MNAVLLPLKYQTPPILTYLGEGLGAAILKAGLRLWDQRTENPAAAIKLARHNIYRPTALIHEAGHQVAHILNWNRELARLFLKKLPQSIAPTWASWASEVAADTFAFVHTGYASVAGLHDVVASDVRSVFRFIDGDPHPISYLRVLLGIEMCRQSYGGGPWEGMENAWRTQYPLSAAADDDQILLHESLTAIPTISQLCLRHPMRSFNGLSIVRLVDPKRVSPQVLLQMEARVGHSLFHSSYWLGSETLRILALTGYRIGVEPGNATRLIQRQAEWMQRAGELEHQAHFQPTHYQTYH